MHMHGIGMGALDQVLDVGVQVENEAEVVLFPGGLEPLELINTKSFSTAQLLDEEVVVDVVVDL